ncbi:MAG: hypothetical protein AAGE80_16820 [Pseudomonadota bacterium]
MISDDADEPHVRFSQRYGLAPVPPQLRLGELSGQFFRLIDYALKLEFDRATGNGSLERFFYENWRAVEQDLHVKFRGRSIREFKTDVRRTERILQRNLFEREHSITLDLLEFLILHPNVSQSFKSDVADAFVQERTAYRVMDNRLIVAIGNDQQADAYMRGISDAESSGLEGARTHLISAGAALRDGDWNVSVRESISAVESAARTYERNANTLGAALSQLKQQGHLNASLLAAFEKLYGYTNTEEGVRHAPVLADKSSVDETDALFMLGTCASFVSYLSAKCALSRRDFDASRGD